MKKFARFTLILFVLVIFGSLIGDVEATEQEKGPLFYAKTAKRLWDERNLSEMRKVLDEGLKKYPQNPGLWDFECAYYLLKKDKFKSLTAAQKAALIKPADFRNQNIAWIYYKLFKDYQSALFFFNKCESLAGKGSSQYFHMAESYRQLGKKEKAKEYYKRFVDGKPKEKKLLAKAREQLAKLQPPVTPPSPPTDNTTFSGPSDPPQPDCCFHIWATGCNLGWSCSLLKYTRERNRWETPDEPTARFLTTAAGHVRAAYFTCSKMNPAWPDWQNRKRFLERQVERFRSKPNQTTRLQLWNTVKGLTHWSEALNRQVVYYKKPQTFANKPTCGEKYFLLGFNLSYAQQSLKIAAEARDQGRNDWHGIVNDGFFHLQKVQNILERYYLIQTGHCVELKDLKLKKRILNIRNPQNSSNDLDNRIRLLDQVINQTQQCMLTKCVEYSQGGETPKPKPALKPSGRLSFEITNVKMKPWIDMGGEVFFDIKVTLGKGAPVTFKLYRYDFRDFSWGNSLEVNWRGKKQIFKGDKDPIKSWIIQRGRKTLKEQVLIHPGETIIVSRRWMQVYNTSDWPQAMIFKFEYTDQGKKVSELSPVMAPSDYWRSFKEMERRVPPKRRERKNP